MGFPFSEQDLSPSVRKSIGELEPLYNQLDDKSREYDHLTKQRSDLQFVTLILGGAGLMFAFAGVIAWGFAILGIVFLGIAGVVYILTFNENSQKLRIRGAEVSELTKTARAELASVSKTIYDELSAVHANKTSPHASRTIVKETVVKEVVMIPCSYCKGLMPQTSVFCPECGARRR